MADRSRCLNMDKKSDKRSHYQSPDPAVRISNGQHHQSRFQKMGQSKYISSVDQIHDEHDSALSTPEVPPSVDAEDDVKQEHADRLVKDAMSPEQMAHHLSS